MGIANTTKRMLSYNTLTLILIINGILEGPSLLVNSWTQDWAYGDLQEACCRPWWQTNLYMCRIVTTLKPCLNNSNSARAGDYSSNGGETQENFQYDYFIP